MSGPITDLEVLRQEYAVVDGEWLDSLEDLPLAPDSVVGVVLRGGGDQDWWELHIYFDGTTCVAGDAPPDAFVAWGCAQLGVPTPWGAAKLLTTQAQECDKAAFALSKDLAIHEGGKSTGLHAAARMLLGEPMWGEDPRKFTGDEESENE